MRRAVAFLGLAVIAAGAVPFIHVPAASGTPQADGRDSAIVMIPASDGYGLNDCLGSGAPCGQVIADAWCEAHGYQGALSFGVARPEDVTGSTATTQNVAVKPAPIAVTCRN